MSKKKPKEYKIDEKTDAKVSSAALALTLIALGVILTAIPDFIDDPAVTFWLRWVFIVLGIVCLFSLFGDKDNSIKGVNELTVGFLFLAIAVAVFVYIPSPYNGFPALVILLLGIFGMLQGLIFVVITTIRSIKSDPRSGESGKVSRSIGIIELLSKIAALVLVLVQLALIVVSKIA